MAKDSSRLFFSAGLLADKLIKSGWSVTRVRKVLQTVGFLGPALALIILSRSKDPRLAVACMTCALGITTRLRVIMPHLLLSSYTSRSEPPLVIALITLPRSKGSDLGVACMTCGLGINLLDKVTTLQSLLSTSCA